jgi:sugar phosphate isomerase/epimerase
MAKQLLDDCNLKTSAGHYDLDNFFEVNQADDLKRYVDECIVGAHILKQDYIVWPWLAPKYHTIDEFKRLSSTLNTIGEQIKKSGLQLAYHNHDFEFTNHNGQMGYDIILNETDENLVKLEIDLFWASFASPVKPHVWFNKQPDRFVLWHVKDMDKNDQNLHVPIGDGKIDFKSIFKDQKLAGVKHIFVEQGNNYLPNDLACVKKSAIYVKNNLL